MDSFELNKVVGAVLGTCLFAMGTGFIAELIYEPKPAGKAGYALPGGGEGGGHGGGGGESAKKEEKPAEGVATLLASADADKGKGGTKACQACHSFEKGGPNKIGPDLWDVVERKKGSHEGFDYSAGMKEKGGTWTYEDLNAFLTKPSDYVKGTKMAFQGISAAPERANVIAYLRTLSESPKPLPEAKKDEGKKDEGKGEEKKDAEGAKKDDGKKAEGGKKDDGKQEEGQKDAGKKEEGKKAQSSQNTEKATAADKASDKPAETTPSNGSDASAKPSAPDNPNATAPAAKPNEGAEKKANDANTGVQPNNEPKE